MNTKPVAKYILISAVIILVLGGGYLIYKNQAKAPAQIPNQLTGKDPANSSYAVQGREVTLTNGYNETTILINGGSDHEVIKTHLFEATAQGDLNGDGQPDYAVILTQDSGGSGTFFYAAAAIKTTGGYIGTNAVLMGDRIAPQTEQILNGLMIANFADRKAGEDFTVRPSQGKSLYLQYFNGTLAARPEAIQLDAPFPYQQIVSPLTISGQARGTWFFEASFPVILKDSDGKTIAQGIAKAGADWMTENFVPFTITLNFTKPTGKNTGSLVLKKDNPSGLPQNDMSYEIPVIFK